MVRYVSPDNYHELFPESANASKLLASEAKERKLVSELAKLKEKFNKEQETLKTTSDLVDRALKQREHFESENLRLKVQTMTLVHSYKMVSSRGNWTHSRRKRRRVLRE